MFGLSAILSPFFFINFANPDFFVNPVLEKDAKGYWLLANNMIDFHVFSRSESPPFIPDIMRVPVYPLFLSVFRYFSLKVGWVYLWQVCFYGFSCVIMYKTVFLLTSDKRKALCSFLLMSFNISAFFYCFQVMTEIMFICFIILSIYFLIKSVLKGDTTSFFLTSIFLGLATLTKPVTLYLIGIYVAIVILNSYLKKENARKIVKKSTIVFLTFVIILCPWVIRNALTFGMVRLTTIDTINAIYYTGASAYQLKHNVEIEEARSFVSDEFKIPTCTVLQNLQSYRFQYPFQNYKALYEDLDKIKMKVVLNYPKELSYSSIFAIIKSHLSHNVGLLSSMFPVEWRQPGFQNIVNAKYSQFFSNLFQNGSLAYVFLYQLVYAGLLYSASLLGLFIFLKDRNISWRIKIILLVLYGYSLLNIIGTGMTTSQRFRMYTELFYYIFAGYGICWLLSFKHFIKWKVKNEC
jgi:4-amino-4-deoxy-L-arabinose transferase-like glycosyltransferase